MFTIKFGVNVISLKLHFLCQKLTFTVIKFMIWKCWFVTLCQVRCFLNFSFYVPFVRKSLLYNETYLILYYNHHQIGGPVYTFNWKRKVCASNAVQMQQMQCMSYAWPKRLYLCTRRWDYLYSWITKSLTISVYLMMIKV